MKIEFTKMHGAANDFIAVDDRELTFPSGDAAWLRAVGARRTGVGCEGFLLIQPSEKADFRMRFFNPDGGEVEMCGNGARCAARFGHDLGAAAERMTIETVAGVLEAEVLGGRVRLRMTDPKDWRMDASLEAVGRRYDYGFVNSGVPHAVVEVEDLDALDVQAVGAAFRYHDDFAPKGTNANFCAVTGERSLRVRTYERGVEGETLACGTGIVASALVMARRGRVRSPVVVRSASGEDLEVGFDFDGDGARNVTLLGSATYVFEGVLTYGEG